MAENPPSTLIASLPFGELRTYDDNEVWLRAMTKPDPAKLRISLPSSLVESNLGSISFNIEREGTMKLDEVAYVMARLTANKQGGALYAAVAPALGQPCKEVLYVDSTAMVVRVPIIGGKATRFYTDGGKFCINWQDDTGVPRGIVYDTKGTTDETKWVAVGQMGMSPL